MRKLRPYLVMLSVIAGMQSVAVAKDMDRSPVFKLVDLPVTTQGPMWPPSETVNENGHFVLVGNVFERDMNGNVVVSPGQAVLVDKNTTPPLDEHGVEDPSLGGAPYQILRQLDLSEGSPDLDMELFSNSYGPANGRGGRPNIPREGDSAYNLNGAGIVCSDVFPASSQADQYTRPSLPLAEVPVYGFKGDDVSHDADTGEALPASEPSVDRRRTTPVTLGDWVQSRGKVAVKLSDRQPGGQFARATFHFRLHDMLPNSLYTVWAVRSQGPDALAIPNVITTDERGKGTAGFEVVNPFPADDPAQRIRGLAIVYHSDQQTWGGCFSRFGPGVDAHGVFNTFKRAGENPFEDFVTVAPRP